MLIQSIQIVLQMSEAKSRLIERVTLVIIIKNKILHYDKPMQSINLEHEYGLTLCFHHLNSLIKN
jgi:hypothetical protein